MPEMPEVETLARKLRRTVVGKCVEDVRLSGLPLRKPIARTFVSKLQGRTIRKIVRRGKYLIAELEPKAYWVIHLGMSGRILYHDRAQEYAAAKHTHAIVRFGDGTELEYRDPRRFGLLAAYEVGRPGMIPEVRCLGMDPLHPGFKEKWLGPMLRKSRQEIKSYLLDQRRVAGLGNIYACESLFLAGIHPARRCLTLDSEETARLIGAIRKVLKTAIRRHGTTFSDFVDSDGKPGDNQNFLMVFQREGENCPRCRAPIKRMRQGNRSSYYCAGCQE
jgi:formamidopyrimidine-DNA glycosylase